MEHEPRPQQPDLRPHRGGGHAGKRLADLLQRGPVDALVIAMVVDGVVDQPRRAIDQHRRDRALHVGVGHQTAREVREPALAHLVGRVGGTTGVLRNLRFADVGAEGGHDGEEENSQEEDQEVESIPAPVCGIKGWPMPALFDDARRYSSSQMTSKKKMSLRNI